MIQLNFIVTDGRQFSLSDVDVEQTVGELKALVAPHVGNVAAERVRLIHIGRVLRDGVSLADSGIVETGTTLNVAVVSRRWGVASVQAAVCVTNGCYG